LDFGTGGNKGNEDQNDGTKSNKVNFFAYPRYPRLNFSCFPHPENARSKTVKRRYRRRKNSELHAAGTLPESVTPLDPRHFRVFRVFLLVIGLVAGAKISVLFDVIRNFIAPLAGLFESAGGSCLRSTGLIVATTRAAAIPLPTPRSFSADPEQLTRRPRVI
jgi:hypothetical protein